MEASLSTSVERPALTRDDLLSVYYDALTPPDLWRVGTEAEKFGLLNDTGAPIPYTGPRSVTAVLGALSDVYGWFPEQEYEGGDVIALRRGEASITLEPGGQLELSGSPFASIHHTELEWRQHLAELHDVSANLGITWIGLGFHPFAKQEELPWVPKLRYPIMKEYLPTRGSGGLDMMRRTCTVQSNIDYESEADAVEKMRISLALSPVITAMFANSPLVEGKLTGERTHRARVWVNMDPDRSGLLPFAWDNMSFERYVEWALDVPMFMVKRKGKAIHNTGQTFRAFMKDGFQGTTAKRDDWISHIGTVFPEVRMKRTIELRGADSLPADLVSALPALTKGLLYEPQARAAAASLASRISFEDAQGARLDIADQGFAAKLGGRPVLEWAQDVLSIAQGGLERLGVQHWDGKDERVYLEPLADLVNAGMTPADALIKKLDLSQPLLAQVIEHTKL